MAIFCWPWRARVITRTGEEDWEKISGRYLAFVKLAHSMRIKEIEAAARRPSSREAIEKLEKCRGQLRGIDQDEDSLAKSLG